MVIPQRGTYSTPIWWFSGWTLGDVLTASHTLKTLVPQVLSWAFLPWHRTLSWSVLISTHIPQAGHCNLFRGVTWNHNRLVKSLKELTLSQHALFQKTGLSPVGKRGQNQNFKIENSVRSTKNRIKRHSVHTDAKSSHTRVKDYYYSWLLYSAVLCSRSDSLRTCPLWFRTSDCIPL